MHQGLQDNSLHILLFDIRLRDEGGKPVLGVTFRNYGSQLTIQPP